jgi:hypothetical protein
VRELAGPRLAYLERLLRALRPLPGTEGGRSHRRLLTLAGLLHAAGGVGGNEAREFAPPPRKEAKLKVGEVPPFPSEDNFMFRIALLKKSSVETTIVVTFSTPEGDPGVINSPDDGPAEFFADYIDGGERTRTLPFISNGVYEITYRVERPDTVSPETVIDSGPSGPTADNTPTFTFSGSDNVTPPSGLLYSYKVDNGEWSPFQAATSTTTPSLSDGPHIFFVKSKDAAGNEDATPAQRSFAVDTVKPRVTSVAPAESATRIAPGTNVVAFFSKDMQPSSINANTVKLFRAGTTTQIGGTVSYDPTTRKATFNPFVNLKLGAKYKAVVTTGAKDLVGNQLDQNSSLSGLQQKSWTFTIRN